MNLEKQKFLASKVLKVGKNKILFDENSLAEIKEALTKQDIRDLYESGIISIREQRGRTAVVKRKTKRRAGKIKRKVRNRKRDYIIIVRKLRRYAKELKIQGKLTQDKYTDVRKKIRAREFKSKAHFKEHLGIKESK